MFEKKDEEFICVNCNKKVSKLKYTSRDHCPYCLFSLHLDITPGDRKNDCKGILKPVYVVSSGKKQQIVYKCEKCKKEIKNIIAEDDDKDVIYKLVENYAKNRGNINWKKKK